MSDTRSPVGTDEKRFEMVDSDFSLRITLVVKLALMPTEGGKV